MTSSEWVAAITISASRAPARIAVRLPVSAELNDPRRPQPGLLEELPARAEKAQRLLYQLELPDEAGKVLCHDRYWTLAFLHRFLDRCDRERLRDPQAAYRMAYLSVQLASLVPLGPERGGYRGRGERGARAAPHGPRRRRHEAS